MRDQVGLITLEAANLFCGSAGSDGSQHLRLVNVHLPGMDEQYIDHRAGGAPLGIEVDVQINKLQCEFALAGWTPNVAELLSSWQQGQQQFLFYGALRDRTTGLILKAEADMTGRLGRAEMRPWQRGVLNDWNYSIRGIIEYTLYVDDEAIYDWSFFDNQLTVNGQ